MKTRFHDILTRNCSKGREVQSIDHPLFEERSDSFAACARHAPSGACLPMDQISMVGPETQRSVTPSRMRYGGPSINSRPTLEGG